MVRQATLLICRRPNTEARKRSFHSLPTVWCLDPRRCHSFSVGYPILFWIYAGWRKFPVPDPGLSLLLFCALVIAPYRDWRYDVLLSAPWRAYGFLYLTYFVQLVRFRMLWQYLCCDGFHIVWLTYFGEVYHRSSKNKYRAL